jgi:hypothetical protein
VWVDLAQSPDLTTVLRALGKYIAGTLRLSFSVPMRPGQARSSKVRHPQRSDFA